MSVIQKLSFTRELLQELKRFATVEGVVRGYWDKLEHNRQRAAAEKSPLN